MAVSFGYGGPQSVIVNPIPQKSGGSSSGSSSSRRSGSGGGSRGSGTTDPIVNVDGFSVVINGIGYSVAIQDQAKFIREKTGGRGSSAQQAIKQAETIAQQERTQQQAQQERTVATQFTGRVRESQISNRQETFERERYLIEGKETGRIEVDPNTGERYAVTTSPSKFTFKQGQQERTLSFSEQGAEVIDSTVIDVPQPFGEGDNINNAIGFSVNDTEQNLTKEQRFLTDPLYARTLPPMERLKLAYGSVPGTAGISVRGGIRTYIEAVDIISAPIMNKLNIPKGSPVSTRIAEDIAIGGLFLGPTSSTTTQIERQLFEVGNINIVGATKQVSDKVVRTDALFTSTRAGKTIKGSVEAQSVKIGSVNDMSVVITGARGQTIKQGVIFPTGKEVIKTGGKFSATDLGVVKQSNNLFASIGKGVLKTRQGINNFGTAGIGQQAGDFIGQVGAVESKGGYAVSRGLFKVKYNDVSNVFQVGSGSGTTALKVTSSTQTASVNTVQSVIKNVATIKPTKPINLFPTMSSSTTTTQVKTAQITPVISTSLIKPIQQSRTSTITLTSSASRSSQKSASIPSLKSFSVLKDRTILKTKQAQFPLQKQRPLQSTRLIQRQQSSNRNISTGFNFNIPRTKKEPIIPFYSKPKKQKSLMIKGFQVLVRRRGEFKVVGIGKTPGQAVNIGKNIVGTTLARTFTIKGLAPTKIQGFRSKKSKEGTLFIEPSRRALGTRSELGEIQFFKSMKGGYKNNGM